MSDRIENLRLGVQRWRLDQRILGRLYLRIRTEAISSELPLAFAAAVAVHSLPWQIYHHA